MAISTFVAIPTSEPSSDVDSLHKSLNDVKQATTNKSAKEQERFEFLDGFRGLCALMVVLGHSAQNSGYGGNYGGALIAVPGFFVLSSFLIVYQLLRSLQKGSVRKLRDLKSFFLIYFCKRFFRIYPLFFIVAYLIDRYPKYGGECGEFYKVVTLQYSSLCIMWTIRPEVYNYIWMPFLALSVHVSMSNSGTTPSFSDGQQDFWPVHSSRSLMFGFIRFL
jgi:peptidoglycan/LPS O-acetylase OafA/YrhL